MPRTNTISLHKGVGTSVPLLNNYLLPKALCTDLDGTPNEAVGKFVCDLFKEDLFKLKFYSVKTSS